MTAVDVERNVGETKTVQKPDTQQPSTEPVRQLTPAEIREWREILQKGRVAQNAHPVQEVMEDRLKDQRQEQQLYTSTLAGWTAVVAVIDSTSALAKEHEHRRAMERIRGEMFELLAKEEKKRKMRDSPFFQQLVSILGESTAESIAKSVDSASASALQANKDALTQAAKDIASALQRGAPHLNLSASGEQLSKALEAEMGRTFASLPRTTPSPSLVGSEESAAVAAHDKLFSLKNSEERLLEVQQLRASLGAEKFASMVDAYDKRFGVPLAAHITATSGSSPARQAEVIYELRSVLTTAQQHRLTEFGQAEYAQVLALINRRTEGLERQLEMMPVQIRAEERHLARVLGRPDYTDLPAEEVRGKMLKHLTEVYPALRGKSWEEVALTLKEIAGERDDKVADQLMRKLLGGSAPGDTTALREAITRTTIHMQKLLVLDQRIAEIKSLLANPGGADGTALKEHYTRVFGAEATKDSPLLTSLTESAALHLKHLGERIADPAISSVQREKLILERDTIEFGMARKIVASSLEGKPPRVQEALKALGEFSAHEIGSERRRSKRHLDAARAISDAIKSAEELRQRWQDVGAATDISNVKLEPARATVGVSCLSAGPQRQPDLHLASRFKELKGEAISSSLPEARTNQPATKDQRTVLGQQQEAALSTRWFSQILDAGGVLETGIVPALKPGAVPSNPELGGHLSSIERLRVEMDAANQRARTSFATLDKDFVNTFTSSDNLGAIQRGVAPAILQKLGTSSSTDLVKQLSRIVDRNQELPVDASTLSALRSQVRSDSAVGKALAVTPRDDKNPQKELGDLLSRLGGVDGARLKVFVVLSMAAQATGEPRDSVTWSSIENEDPALFMSSVNAGMQLARASLVEKLLEKITDAEQEEVLALFEATTRQSIGAALISGLSVNDNREAALGLLAQSRIVTAADLQRYASAPLPQDRTARAQAILREFAGDQQRRQLDVTLTRTVAENVSQRYATLRAAAEAAAFNPALASEIADQMRVIESQLQGKVAQTLASHDPAQAARQGFDLILRDTIDQVMTGRQALIGSPNSSVADVVRHVHELLASEEPKTDAAFNRIRQLNLSEEETLLVKALYSAKVASTSSIGFARPLTGDLSRDLQPLKQLPLESERIGALMKGGAHALAQADIVTLNRAIAEKNEKVQLETLSNLRASTQYDSVKDSIPQDKLQPAAKSYHQAVTSNDRVRADMADISVKARNKDLKPEEVATFVQGKSSQDLARIDVIDPNFRHTIKLSNPDYFDDKLLKVLSARESERREAINQAMLKSLTDPTLFAQWLNVAETREAKAEALRALERLIEKLPTAPKFATHSDPLRDEPKIVQYVRAQKTDFREMDAYLINGIIVSALSTGTALKPEVLEQIRALRLEAASQLKAMDAFIEPRENVVKAARQVLATYEGAQIWATGDPVLRGLPSGSSSAKAQRAARVAELIKRYPNLAGRTEEMLQEGERGLRWEWWSGKHLDAQIPLTEKRIAAQRQLLTPMERGLTDSNQTRELMRATFGLRAKDAAEGIFRGLTAESTQNAMVLLRQRDAKVVYRVTDQKEHEEWVRVTAQAESDLARKDKILNWSITISKVVVVVVVSAIPALGPGVGFAVATSINLLDKVRRRFINGEDFDTVNGAFWNELMWDGLFFALSYSVVKYTASAGTASAKAAGKQIVGEGTQRQSNIIIRGAKRILGYTEEAAPNLRRGGELLHISERSAASSGIRNAWDSAQKIWVKTTGGQGWQPTTFLIEGGGKSGRMAAWRPTDTKMPGSPLAESEEATIALGKKTPPASTGTPPPAKPKVEEVDPAYALVARQRPAAQLQSPPTEPALPTPAPAAQPKPEPVASANSTATPSQNVGSGGADQHQPRTPPAPPPAGGEPPSGGEGGAGGGNAPSGGESGAPRGSAPGKGIQVVPPHQDQLPNQGNLPHGNGVAAPGLHVPPQGGTPSPSGAHVGPGIGPQIAASQPGLNPNLHQNGVPLGHANGSGNVNGSGNSLGLGIGNGISTGTLTGNGLPHPQWVATSQPQGDATASSLALGGLIAASATPRQELQSNLMHNATANGAITAQPTPQQLAQPQPANTDYILQVAEALKVEQLHERERQVQGEQYAESVQQKTQERTARREREKLHEMGEEVERSFAKVDATKESKRIAAAESIGAPVTGETPLQPSAQRALESTTPLVEAASLNSITSREQGAESAQEAIAEQVVLSKVERANSDAVSFEKGSLSQETPVNTRTSTTPPESVVVPLSTTTISSSHEHRGHSAVDAVTSTVEVALETLPPTQEALPHERQQVEPLRVSIATLSPNTPAPLTTTTTPAATYPIFIPPTVVSPIANTDSGSSDEGDQGGSSAPKRRGKKTDAAQEARMRALIMQQLMTQHINRAQREKLLKTLIELGISEQEYRSLVAKLGEMEVTRIAQQNADRKRFTEPVAIAVETPTIRDSVKSPPGVVATPTNEVRPHSNTSQQTTRAEIYKRLREESSAKRKGC